MPDQTDNTTAAHDNNTSHATTHNNTHRSHLRNTHHLHSYCNATQLPYPSGLAKSLLGIPSIPHTGSSLCVKIPQSAIWRFLPRNPEMCIRLRYSIPTEKSTYRRSDIFFFFFCSRWLDTMKAFRLNARAACLRCPAFADACIRR